MRRFVILAALMFGGLPSASAATFVWDDDSADHAWSNPLNWNLDDGVPGPADTVIFPASGSNRVDADFAIRTLTNATGTNAMAIADGATLCVTQAFWGPYDGTLTISGGVFRLEAGALGVLYGSALASPPAPLTNACLTLSDTVLEIAGRPAWALGRNASSFMLKGTVDLSDAILSDGVTSNMLALGRFNLDQNVKDWTRETITILRLPPDLRDIDVAGEAAFGSVDISHRYASTPWTILDFGTNPALATLSVSGHLSVGKARIQYSDGATLFTNRFPPNLDMTIGRPDAPVRLTLARTTGSESDVVLTAFRSLEAHLDTLEIGRNLSAGGPNSGELDLTATNTLALAGSITTDRVSIASLLVGDSGSTGSGTSYGTLKLPRTVTNLTVNTLALGSMGGGYGLIDLGSNTLFQSLTISNSLTLGMGDFQYLDLNGNSRTGLPPGSVVRLGDSAGPRAAVIIGEIVGSTATARMGPGIASFEARLSSLRVGDRYSPSRRPVGILDLRDAETVTLDIEGPARIGSAENAKGSLYLADTHARATNLVVGYDDPDSAGLLALSNATFAVDGTATVTLARNGRIETICDGRSAGLDLASTNLSVHAASAIALTFLRDPDNPGEGCWGLRLAGDATDLLSSLTQETACLTWSLDGLSDKMRARFGIHYDPLRDQTLVGIPRAPGGVLILVR